MSPGSSRSAGGSRASGGSPSLGALLVILGPTATGKSDLALRCARQLGGRIIGADSVQVYRGLDAGSGKPTPEARREIRHDLIDVADPAEPYSAGRFARQARAAIEAARSAGEAPIVVGGTGLYLRVLLRGIAPMPPRDESVRARLYARAEACGVESLHDDLAGIDADTAARVGRRDLQRIVRALEVAELTGVPLSRHIERNGSGAEALPCVKVGLTMDRASLYRRIDARVETIFDAGIVEEVSRLLAAGLSPRANALKALGYREVVRHLEGEFGRDETIRLVKRNTRHYARRQLAWFRREPAVVWRDPEREGGPQAIADEAVMLLRAYGGPRAR